MSTITVTLLNWRRPENLRRLLDSLATQTLRPYLVLWNNGATLLDSRLHVVVQSCPNLRCWPRWFLASLTESDYVCSLDDDLALGDERVLEDLVRAMDEDGVEDRVYGLDGLLVPPGTSYRCGLEPEVEDLAPVDLLKGRLMALRRTALARVGMLPGITEDDIALCGLLAAGRAQYHREVGWLRGRVEELPDPYALVDQPGHYNRREAALRQYFR